MFVRIFASASVALAVAAHPMNWYPSLVGSSGCVAVPPTALTILSVFVPSAHLPPLVSKVTLVAPTLTLVLETFGFLPSGEYATRITLSPSWNVPAGIFTVKLPSVKSENGIVVCALTGCVV